MKINIFTYQPLKLKLIAGSIALLIFFISGCNKDTTEPKTADGADTFICTGEYGGSYWPTSGWRTCSPGAVGMDPEKLKKAYTYAANSKIKTDGIIIIKDGYITGEAYFGSFTRNTKHQSFSITKNITSCLTGIALDNGSINNVDYEIYNYFPEWQKSETDAKKKKITVRHLLSMTSGLEWIEKADISAPGDDDMSLMYKSEDFIQYVLKKPVIDEPGSKWFYSNGASMLLSGIIENVSGQSEYNFAVKNLFLSLGIIDVLWESDKAGHNTAGWGIQMTMRDLAKFAYLYLKEGEWSGRQIISKSRVKESIMPVSSEINYYGHLWWLLPYYNNYQSYNIPEGTFFAFGAKLQFMIIVPKKNMVIIRLGTDEIFPGNEWETLKFLNIILDSIN